MQIRATACLSLLFVLAACASNPPEAKDQASADMECEMVTPTGSTVIKRVCHQKMTPEERQRMIEIMREKTRPSGVTAPGG